MTSALPSMPEEEISLLSEAYRDARVILEYGSGGSTRMAADMQGKYIMSVESDYKWARALHTELASRRTASPVSLHYVDIGVTGPWGRVIDDEGWREYHRYPNSIWEAPYFREPDVVLIDGRFRVACLLTVMMRCTRPTRVLFDDYGDRPKYWMVEALIAPRGRMGRMAEFIVEPQMIRREHWGFVIAQYFDVTLLQDALHAYDMTEQELAELKSRFADAKTS